MKHTHMSDEEVIDFLENNRADEEMRAHTTKCVSCRKKVEEYEMLLESMASAPEQTPPERIAWNFTAALEEEKRKVNPAASFPYWQIAAAVALLIVGFLSGKYLTPDHSDEMLALQAQVDLLKEISMVNTLKNPSASERIRAVNMIEEDKAPTAGKQLIDVLINTLNNDESPNVRYAAAMALGRFIDQEEVRLALAESLKQQEDALIQIALISMLVEAQEKTAIQPLKQIIESDENAAEVKKQARVALEILS